MVNNIITTSILSQKVKQHNTREISGLSFQIRTQVYVETLNDLENYLDTSDFSRLSSTSLRVIKDDILEIIRGIREIKQNTNFVYFGGSLDDSLEALRSARDAVHVALEMFDSVGGMDLSKTRKFLSELRTCGAHIRKANALLQELPKMLTEHSTIVMEETAKSGLKPVNKPRDIEVHYGSSLDREDHPDEVSFTAYYPEKGDGDKWYTLLVYAHLVSAIEKVRQDVERFKDQLWSTKEVSSTLSTQIAHGAEITIIPSCDNVAFNPPQITIKWMEDFHRADFRFCADKSLIGDVANGVITIYLAPFIIGTLKFAVPLDQSKEVSHSIAVHEERTTMYGKDDVFISYSRKDTDVARIFKTILSATGMDVFLDVDNLRSGQLWKNELLSRIEHAKIFQLFWSESYSQSKNCRMEWKHALKQKKGEGYIRPVYWKVPLSPNPPHELSKFNFQYVELPYNKDNP